MKRPTSEAKRIRLLDVYRGFAIFGIFVVNIGIMNSTFLNQFKNDIFSNIIFVKGADFKSVKTDDIRDLKTKILEK